MHNKYKTHCKYGHEFTTENTAYKCGSRRCRICHRTAAKARYYNDPKYRSDVIIRATNRNKLPRQKQIKSNWKFQNKLSQYGLTEDQFNTMQKAQDKKCAICGVAKVLCIDHDHKTGRVRKLICHNCNLGIGNFRDNPDLLYLAAQYLKDQTWQ